MTGIQVIFSKPKTSAEAQESVKVGSVGDGEPTSEGVHVAQDPQALMGNQLLVWHITSENEEIDNVEIQFEDPELEYFHDADGIAQPNRAKTLTYRNVTVPQEDPAKRQATQLIWTQPVWPDGIPDTTLRIDAKYNIIGYGGGKVLIKLDPKILVIRP